MTNTVDTAQQEQILCDLHDLGFHGKDLAHLERLADYILSLTNEAELRGRTMHLSDISRAVGILEGLGHPDKYLSERRAALLKLSSASSRQPERSQDNLTPGMEPSA